MELQQEKFPSFDQRLPWVVPALTEAVLRLQGPRTEGIFRWIYFCVLTHVTFIVLQFLLSIHSWLVNLCLD